MAKSMSVSMCLHIWALPVRVFVDVNASYLYKCDYLYLPTHLFSLLHYDCRFLPEWRACCKQGLCIASWLRMCPFIFAPSLRGPVGPLQAAVPCKAAWGPRQGVEDSPAWSCYYLRGLSIKKHIKLLYAHRCVSMCACVNRALYWVLVIPLTLSVTEA